MISAEEIKGESKKQEEPKALVENPVLLVLATIGIFFFGQIFGYLLFVVLFSLGVTIHSGFEYGFGQDGTFFKNNLKQTFEYGPALKPVYIFLQVLSMSAITMLLLYMFMKFRNISRSILGIQRSVKLRYVGYALGGFALYFVVYIGFVLLTTALFPDLIDLQQEQDIGFSKDTSGTGLIFVALAVLVLAPVTEELLMRGFLFGGLRGRLGFKLAAVITSILFAFAHLPAGKNGLLWVAAVDTFILSLVLCYLREKTGSLWPSIGVHALKNALAFIVLFNIVGLIK